MKIKKIQKLNVNAFCIKDKNKILNFIEIKIY